MDKAIDKQSRMDQKIQNIEDQLMKKASLGYKRKLEQIETLKQKKALAASSAIKTFKEDQQLEEVKSLPRSQDSGEKRTSSSSRTRSRSRGLGMQHQKESLNDIFNIGGSDDDGFRSCHEDELKMIKAKPKTPEV